jgi:hypothetical protein
MLVRRRLAIAGALLLVCAAAQASAEKLSAADWRRIPVQRKLYFVFASRERFQEEGTVFGRSAEEYVTLLDREAASARPGDDMDSLFRSLAAAETAPEISP